MLTPISLNQALATTPSPIETASINPQAISVASASSSTEAAGPSTAATKSTASVDTATISNAGKQALQESLETNAQTTKEASHGDLQAKRLLAKEAAAKAAREA